MNTIQSTYRQHRRNEISCQQWWDFIATQQQPDVKRVVEGSMKAEKRLRMYKDSFRFVTKVRKYVSLFLYTDIHAYEVVKVISDKCVEIRRLDATCVKPPTQFYPGGFSGHYADNHNQTWEFKPNEANAIVKLRLGKKGWGLGKYRMLDNPMEHYDYNF